MRDHIHFRALNSQPFRSFLLAKEGHTPKPPLVHHYVCFALLRCVLLFTLIILLWLRTEVELSDQVLIRAHVVLVHRAWIHRLLILSLVLLGCAGALVLLGSGAIGVHLDVGEGEVKILALRVLEVPLRLVPSGALQVQTMDPYTVDRLLDSLAFDSGIVCNNCVPGISDVGTLFDGIEGPVIVPVGAGDLLANGGQESLRVEEASQPEGDWALHGPLL